MRRALVVAGAALALAGCCAPRRLPTLPRVRGPAASPERLLAVLDRLDRQTAALASFKVMHRISLTSREGVSSGSLRGVVAVRRPDRYRLQVLGPAALLVLDLLWHAGRFDLSVPPRGVRMRGDARTPREALGGVPVDGLARAFLGGFPRLAARLVERGRWAVLTLEEPSGARRLVYLDRRTAAVMIDARFEGGRETLRLTQRDHRMVDGVPFPYRIRCDLPEEGIEADIEVERVEPARDLPDELFER